MSILINMEMPTRCFSCPMCDVEGAEVNCAISHGSYIEYREVDQKVAMQDRPEWCPLIEVPPHGRLIDADALEVQNGWLRDSKYFAQESSHTHITFVYSNDIYNAPTVIPADKDGET